MQSRWSDAAAQEFVSRYGATWGEDLSLRAYLSLLIGAEQSLVLHGGGNCSVKTAFVDIFGEPIETILIKASGRDMATMGPDGFVRLDLEYLKKLRALEMLSDEDMVREFRMHQLDTRESAPSIETLVHVLLPKKFVDHTHADAVLALTNQSAGKRLVRQALGPGVLVLDYVKPGFKLAQAAAAAYEADPESKAMVWMQHGIVSWGETARESYETTIALITRAEEFLAQNARRPLVAVDPTELTTAEKRWKSNAPLIRGLLAQPSAAGDGSYSRMILQALINRATLDFVDSDQGRELAISGPLTSDHLIRTKSLPLWIDAPAYDDPDQLRDQIGRGIKAYAADYDAYLERHAARMPAHAIRIDSLPRMILMPGLGAICCGHNVASAKIARDITAHTLAVKAQIAAFGDYRGMEEEDLFDMEYRTLQQAKLGQEKGLPLDRHVALITGAAGAIGSGIAQELLEQGCHVALTDLPGQALASLAEELNVVHGDRVLAVELDVTDPGSVARGFEQAAECWGGIDLVVPNAGLAHVSPLAKMNMKDFRRLERVNIEGTLLVLAEAARHFKLQGTGGDIVLVSTKNVFAPGATFGAYSATKAAAHQLARIASLELGGIGVRVNMVSPDAVFSSESRKSGLWAEVGPDRMKARGLDAQGLEEYYRNRNLLKARITARHVGKAVLYFATRQTPTTGATIPVDGGLPDSTPR